MALRASEASTPSDEALVMWLVWFNAKDWEAKNDIEAPTEGMQDNESDAIATETRKRKTKGAHMLQANLQGFLEMLIDVELKRGMSERGKD